MKFLVILFLISLLEDNVIGKSIVKRDCNSNCCCRDCDNCCSSNCQSNSNCNNCCQSNSNCNNCCNSRCNNCQGCQSTCKENCPSNCGTTEQVPVLVPFPPLQPTAPLVNSTNTNIYNFTANITITNVINTVNNISIPITLNNTNINRITIDPAPPSNVSERNKEDIRDNRTCCIVIHPRVCNQNGCYVITHRECSSICTGEVVTITQTTTSRPVIPPNWCLYNGGCPSPIPFTPPTPTSTPSPTPLCPQQNGTSNSNCTVPPPVYPWCIFNGGFPGCSPPPPLPQPQPCPQQPVYQPSYLSGCIQPPYIPPFQPPTQNCQVVGSYPYNYCGNYETLNCQGCYFCNGRYNPQECAYSSECPLPCRIRG